MAKYRKIPVVIDAWQNGSDAPMPDWLVHAIQNGRAFLIHKFVSTIHTLEGVVHPEADDWIIRGVAGEIYCCKPHIFAQTYDAVEEETRVFDTTYSDTHSS